MRSPEEVFEDLEADRASREAEINFLKRIHAENKIEQEQEMLRRSIALLTYAHFEGFCKFSLTSYASFINALNVPCLKASPAVVAASLTKVFAALRDNKRKHDSFRRSLPDDGYLHLAAREQEFIENYSRLLEGPVEIPDAAVDTKSNVNADVLRKLLFQLGLDFTIIELHRSNINKLLGVRNAIAHGDRLSIPENDKLESYIETAYEVMKYLQNKIYDAMQGSTYLKKSHE